MSQVQRLDSVAEITMGQAPAGESYNVDANGMPLIAGAGDIRRSTSGTEEVHELPRERPVRRATIIRRNSEPPSARRCLRVDSIASVAASPGFAHCPGLDGRYLWHWLTHAAPDLVTKAKGVNIQAGQPPGHRRAANPGSARPRAEADCRNPRQGGRAAGQAPGRPRPTPHPHPIHLPRHIRGPRG